ncbi:MAG TPA: hypothetical protein VGP47_04635, partial [Parachlamydiaceae bacterium]|nr:hypothetical protein [Parachlamydiaceae bacterium]
CLEIKKSICALKQALFDRIHKVSSYIFSSVSSNSSPSLVGRKIQLQSEVKVMIGPTPSLENHSRATVLGGGPTLKDGKIIVTAFLPKLEHPTNFIAQWDNSIRQIYPGQINIDVYVNASAEELSQFQPSIEYQRVEVILDISDIDIHGRKLADAISEIEGSAYFGTVAYVNNYLVVKDGQERPEY